MPLRRAFAATVVLFLAVCLDAVPAQGQKPGQEAIVMATTLPIPPDSLYRLVRTRLTGLSYQFDVADSLQRRMVVRTPDKKNRVEVGIRATGDSSTISFTPMDRDAFAAVLTVTHDATFKGVGEAPAHPVTPGALPESNWRPELFVSPQGRIWLARGGVFAADSLPGPWRTMFAAGTDSVDDQELSLGLNLALVDDTTILIGLHERFKDSELHLLRTTDAARSWTPVSTPGIVSIDEMAARGPSVWVVATRWDHNKRRGVFMRSEDGGASWVLPGLPPKLNDANHLYRISQSSALLATAGFNKGPVFWRTTDSGNSWIPIPTPRDKGLNKVPSNGTRIEQIATAGEWLVVREYGAMFVSRTDSIEWRRVDGIEDVAADRERDGLFVLTDSLQAEMLDRDLRVLWKSDERIPAVSATDVEKVLARDGVGYVSLSHGEIYQAREGHLVLVQPAP
jgi:hypothetical protein